MNIAPKGEIAKFLKSRTPEQRKQDETDGDAMIKACGGVEVQPGLFRLDYKTMKKNGLI
jgi:hypothetical protein